MSGRYRTVALQAVGVAILAAFVFVAFLRPSEPGDLSGIDVPGGGDGQTVVDPDPDDEPKKGGKNGGKGQDRPGGNNGSNGSPGDNGNGGNGRPGGGNGPRSDDGTTPPGGDDNPPDDQYTDLVSVLMKQVGEPQLFKEIDDP